jgi:hypothetical protein
VDYSFKIEPKEGYLHIRVEGNNTPETISRYLKEIHEVCLKSGCPNVLVEESLFGPGMGLLDIFDIVSRRALEAFPVVQRIAYVDTNPKHDLSNMKFAETAAVNRSMMNLNVFGSASEAEAWLVRELQAPPS